ncbi:hypothetical protein ACJX0J_036475 [Zea mays]
MTFGYEFFIIFVMFLNIDQYREVSIQFVLPFIFIVVIDNMASILTQGAIVLTNLIKLEISRRNELWHAVEPITQENLERAKLREKKVGCIISNISFIVFPNFFPFMFTRTPFGFRILNNNRTTIIDDGVTFFLLGTIPYLTPHKDLDFHNNYIDRLPLYQPLSLESMRYQDSEEKWDIREQLQNQLRRICICGIVLALL